MVTAVCDIDSYTDFVTTGDHKERLHSTVRYGLAEFNFPLDT